ncbi:MAG: DUF1638 domain-containing protein [Verrucomicrobiae bacterium]|nr:DUF1638 domain-containing protein [Verrucomicrobiae bacterium]
MKKLKLISCEIFYREMCAAAARSPCKVDIEFLRKGLHDLPCREMQQRVQEAVDRVAPGQYDAIVLGFALCNNGIAELQARHTPLIIPRAHDCITLFLGGKERYMDYFNTHPGVYFKTTGWIERSQSEGELAQLSVQRKSGMDASYEEMVAKYGEDNAKYLREQLCNPVKNYSQLAFIEMGIEPGNHFEEQTREEARQKGWRFEKITGDLSLIQRLLSGEWSDREFLTVPPGHRVAPSFDDNILKAE